MPLYLGLMAGIYKAEKDMKPLFTKISQGASGIMISTGLPKLLKELTETAELATGIADSTTSGMNQSIEVLNKVAVDNFPKMVEQLTELNSLLSSHVQKIQEGTETELKVALNLDTKEIYESIYNYKHPSGGTVKFNSGKT
jgi:dsDNA-binding SOS-regulon protein